MGRKNDDFELEFLKGILINPKNKIPMTKRAPNAKKQIPMTKRAPNAKKQIPMTKRALNTKKQIPMTNGRQIPNISNELHRLFGI